MNNVKQFVNGLEVGKQYVQAVRPTGDDNGHRVVKVMRLINHRWVERRGVECECGRKYWGVGDRANRTHEEHAKKMVARGIKPVLPAINSKVSIFGVSALVSSIEPESDWTWRVNLASVNALGATEEWHLIVPTDYRTEDGMSIADGNTAFIQPEDATCSCGAPESAPESEHNTMGTDPLQPEPFTIRDDCGLCGEDATLDDYAEFIQPDGSHIMAHSSCAAEFDLQQA